MIDRQSLLDFTAEVSARFVAGEIPGPIHLNSDTQIDPLLDIFRDIKRTDWVLGTWRSMYHALLHGVPRDQVMAEVIAGRSMSLHFPYHRFMTSAIVGGMLPIACGLAALGDRVWVFCGDMAAQTGGFHEAEKYAGRNHLPVTFVVEDNGLSTNTPTLGAWGSYKSADPTRRYQYKRTTPHYGVESHAGF